MLTLKWKTISSVVIVMGDACTTERVARLAERVWILWYTRTPASQNSSNPQRPCTSAVLTVQEPVRDQREKPLRNSREKTRSSQTSAHQILQRPDERRAETALIQLFSITQIYDLMNQLQDIQRNIHQHYNTAMKKNSRIKTDMKSACAGKKHD